MDMKKTLERLLCAAVSVAILAGICACGGGQAAVDKKTGYGWSHVTDTVKLPGGVLELTAVSRAGTEIAAAGRTDTGGCLYFCGADGGNMRGTALAEGEYIYALSEADGECVWCLSRFLPEKYYEENGLTSTNGLSSDYILSLCDTKGNTLETIPAAALDGYAIAGILKTKSGFICWDSSSVIALCPDGSLSGKAQADGVIVGIYGGADSIIACVDDAKGFKTRIMSLDNARHTLNTIASYNDGKNYSSICDGLNKGGTALINDGTSLLEFNYNEKSAEKLFDWADYLVDGGSVICMLRMDENSFAGCLAGEPCLYLFTRSWEMQDRQELTLATTLSQPQLKAYISYFNSHNKTYRIVLKDYTGKWERLKTEIMAGEGPDILDAASLSIVPDGKNFTDLLPYLKNDAAIDTADFVPGILELMETKGGLYCACDSFDIETIAAEKAVGAKLAGAAGEDWLRLAKDCGGSCRLFSPGITRLEFRDCAYSAVCRYIDWSSGACTIDTESMAQFLELWKALPDTCDPDTADWSEKVLLSPVYVQSPASLESAKSLLGGSLCYVGYPCGAQSGGVVRRGMNLQLAVTNSCADKDGAWQFVRGIYLQDLNDVSYRVNALPIVRTQLEKMLSDAVADGSGTFTQEDADTVMKLIASTRAFSNGDTELRDLVWDEAQAYFSGSCTSAQAAERIQSRVNLYTSEKY